MAFKTSNINGYGTGALGTVSYSSGQINSYANITAISTNTITIGTPSNGIYETFAVGKEILLHVSAITTGTDYSYLGKYMVATITNVNGSILTLSQDVSGLIASGVLANHHVQAITIAQFNTLNLSTTLAPLAYNTSNKYGGIVALKAKTALNLSGSALINLVAKGIPITNVAYRPATTQEGTANQIGWENHITARNFYLNCPDGAAFIVAATVSNTGTTARIGSATTGVALYPYNAGATSTTPVQGGPTILLAAGTITGFDVSLISKASSNTSGSGLGRCYIATDSQMPADEGLYALDCLSNSSRLVSLGIKNYGAGTLGSVASLGGQINSYAPVTAISGDGLTLTIGTAYNGVYEQIEAGKLVMFHVSRQIGSDTGYLGKFILAKVLSVVGSAITLDTPVTNVVSFGVTTNYKCQLLTVAQFDSLAWSGSYTGAKAFNDTHGCGGVLAIAAKTAVDLSGGQLNMEGKGVPASVSRPVVTTQSSGHQADCLPLSQGGGAVFILANQLTVNASSRIGGSQSGALYGGTAGAYNSGDGGKGGAGYGGGSGGGGAGNIYPGVAGAAGRFGLGFGGGSGGGGGYGGYNCGAGGSGAVIGDCGSDGIACDGAAGIGGDGGCSIFIVANTLVSFVVSCLCTGGGAGHGGGSGGSYGGGGGGGGAGAPGTCFVYANTLTSPDYTALLAS